VPEGRCVNVCGTKYTQKKNNYFKVFKQLSFSIDGRKAKIVKDRTVFLTELMDKHKASS